MCSASQEKPSARAVFCAATKVNAFYLREQLSFVRLKLSNTKRSFWVLYGLFLGGNLYLLCRRIYDKVIISLERWFVWGRK